MKKIISCTERVNRKVNDEYQFKLSVPHVVSFGKVVHSMTVNIKETAYHFLDRAIKAHLTNQEIEKIDEIEIGFISDLKNITFNHYMDQPKSLICRKMLSRFIEVESEDNYDFK